MSNSLRLVQRIFLSCYTILCLHAALIARCYQHPRLSHLLFVASVLLGIVWLGTFVRKRP